MPSDQLPTVIPPGTLATPVDGQVVPVLIANLGDAAAWRYIGFFTANIRNPHTRHAYARACSCSVSFVASWRGLVRNRQPLRAAHRIDLKTTPTAPTAFRS